MEHIRNVLPMMQELHRIAAPDARMVVRVPYDPPTTPLRTRPTCGNCLSAPSAIFSQPYYWRADYGYRGDWLTESVTLEVQPSLAHLPDAELWDRVNRERNVVTEMVATLRAIKPIREPRRELQQPPTVYLLRP